MSLHARPKLRRQCVCLALLLSVALVLRAVRPELMEWKHDEAVAWLRAHALRKGFEFPSAGLASSQGLENFPLFLYVLAICDWALGKPELAVWPLAIANSAAVLFIFGGVRRIAGRRAAWLTALLYAISPCAVFFSRKLWAQDLMPFWSCAMFYCMTVMLTNTRSRWAPLFFGLLAATSFQLHFSALFLCVGYGAVVLISWKSLRLAPIVIGFGLGLTPALPYFHYQFMHGWAGVHAATQSLGEAARWRVRDLLLYFLRQPADENFHALLGPEYHDFLAALPGCQPLRYCLSGLVAAGFVICAVSMFAGNRRRRRAGFPILLASAGLAAFGVARIPLSPSYFVVFYPIPFLLAALPMVAAWRALRMRLSARAARLIAAALLLALAAHQLAYSAAFLARIGREGGTRGDYGPAYVQTRAAARWLLENCATTGFWSFAELPVLACAVSLSEGSTPASEAPVSGGSSDFLVIHKLLYPQLAPQDAQWIKQSSAAYHCLAAPADRLMQIETVYPPPALTERQQLESERARSLAVRLFGHP